ncbi:MAG: FAD binding domain-containing protein [Sneathiella sp.]
MISSSFAYARPDTLSEAVHLLQKDKAVALSGGHSLMTDLKQRHVQPDLVVDINGLALTDVQIDTETVSIEALVRQNVLLSENIASAIPLLSEVANSAADPSIRARGTLVGALCAAERQGDWAAAALALDAQLHLANSANEKVIVDYGDRLAAGQVFCKGELVTRVGLKRPQPGAVQGYRKVKHAAVGWSIASLAYNLAPGFARIAVSGAPSVPCRLNYVEQYLISGNGSLKEAIATDFEAITFVGDSYASAAYREQRLSILVQRTIKEIREPLS